MEFLALAAESELDHEGIEGRSIGRAGTSLISLYTVRLAFDACFNRARSTRKAVEPFALALSLVLVNAIAFTWNGTCLNNRES